MRKPLALSAYLALRQSRTRPLGEPPPKRPKGPLVWVHCKDPGRLIAIQELEALLTEDGDEVTVMVTTEATDPFDRLILQPAPEESQPAVRSFLNHWRPNVLVWLDGPLRPALISQAAERPMTRLLLDVTAATPEPIQRVPGLNRAVLSLFNTAICSERSGVQRLEAAGLPASAIRQAQAFDPGPRVPLCDEPTRADIAAHLGARPVWLAARPEKGELPALVAAQKFASRRSHRLMLILACDDTTATARVLDTLDMPFHMYSDSALPSDGTQLMVTDASDLGLWYRLAPISFVGGSLSTGATVDPFDIAGLGSVVVHGPEPGPYGQRFSQLREGTASSATPNAADLGAAVEGLLSPDKAATIAHAAWDVTSRGAETAAMVSDLILEALDRIGG